MTKEKESILQEAERIINGERRVEYGDARDCFALISNLWTEYSIDKLKDDTSISAHDVAMMMCLMKIARTTTGAKKRDTYVDIAGYAALAANL